MSFLCSACQDLLEFIGSELVSGVAEVTFHFDFFVVGDHGFQISSAQGGECMGYALTGAVAVEADRLLFGDDEIHIAEDEAQDLFRTETPFHQGGNRFQISQFGFQD